MIARSKRVAFGSDDLECQGGALHVEPCSGLPVTFMTVVSSGRLHPFGAATLSTAGEEGFSTMIVDNGRRSLDLKDANRAEIYIRIDNKGYGHAVNVGVEVARRINGDSAYFLAANDDILLPAASLRALAAALRAAERTTAFTVVSWNRDASIYFAGGSLDRRGPILRHWAELPPPRPFESEALNGAVFALPVDVFQRLGGFDERYFLYFEDLDLSLKLRESAIPIVVLPGYEVVHDGGASTSENLPFRRYQFTRSQLLFTRKWLGRRAMLRVAIRVITRGLVGALVGQTPRRQARLAGVRGAARALIGRA
jgi:N-acetylglucosaminyl-diphospho-decaprenol L-rhamnosyltransferase